MKSLVYLLFDRILSGEVVPYDESSREVFLDTLRNNKGLQDTLLRLMNSDPEWIRSAINDGMFFIVNKNLYRTNPKPSIRLGLIGLENAPTISIDL